MPTRNVVLTDNQDEMINQLVETGRYQNASEVLRAGLRLVESNEAEHAAKLTVLRASVQVGIDDIENGRYKTFENGDSLIKYLNSVTDKVLSPSREQN